VQTFALAANLYKRVYIPGIRDQLHNGTPGLGILAKTGRNAWSGSSVYLANRTGRNRSYRPTSAARNASAFPTSGRQTYGNFVVPVVILHGTGGIEALASAASQGSESAFAEALKSEVQGHKMDWMKDLEIDFYGTPLGVLGRLSANPGAVVQVTVEQDPDSQLVHWRGNGTRYFSVNQEIEIFSEDGVTRRVDAAAATSFTVASVDTEQLLSFDTAVEADVTTGDLLVRQGTFGAQADPGDNSEAAFAFNGLEQIFADNSVDIPARGNSMNYELDVLQGVDRGTAANSFAVSNVLDNNGAVLTRNTVHNAVKRQKHSSGTYPDVILCEDAVQIALQDLMVGDQRYEPQVFPGGFKADALLWNAGNADIPVLATRECPYDRMYGLSLDCVEYFVLQDLELIETDGSVLRQAAAGGDQWEFNWRMFANMGSRQPNGGFKITRIGGADELYGLGAGNGPVYTF